MNEINKKDSYSIMEMLFTEIDSSLYSGSSLELAEIVESFLILKK